MVPALGGEHGARTLTRIKDITAKMVRFGTNTQSFDLKASESKAAMLFVEVYQTNVM